MPTEISLDTPKEIVPLAWMLGTWAGAGVVGYPDTDDLNFGQEITFAHHGDPFVHYTSRMWALDSAGKKIRALDSERGYWRIVVPQDAEAAAKEAAGVDLEVMMAHPSGVVEIYLGRASGGRIDLSTDVVARTETASEYSAGKRMYGLVQSDLFWVYEMAARGRGMHPYASARLKKVSGEVSAEDAINATMNDGPRA